MENSALKTLLSKALSFTDELLGANSSGRDYLADGRAMFMLFDDTHEY